METGRVTGPIPPRPYIPPTALLAASTCASCAAVMNAGWLRRESGSVVPWGLIGTVWAIALLALAIILRMAPIGACWRGVGHCARGRRIACGIACCTGLVLGVSASGMALLRWQGMSESMGGQTVSSCVLTAVGDPRTGEHGVSTSAEVRPDRLDIPGFRVRMISKEPFEGGVSLRAVGRFEALGDDEWDRSRFMKGEVGSVSIRSVIEVDERRHRSMIDRFRSVALEAIGPEKGDARALVAAAVCGRMSELNGTRTYDEFSRCGLTHLIAVSGGHLAYIAAILGVMLSSARCGRCAQSVTVVLVMGLYVVFTGASPSALRSVVMVGLSHATILGGRRAHALSALFLTMTAMAVSSPGIVFDLGFQLSAASVLFIAVFSRYIAHMLGRLRLPGALSDALALSLVAQWATLPLTIPVFGEASLVAPLANILVGPLMTAVLIVGLITVALCTLFLVVMWALPPLALLLGPLCEALTWCPDAIARLSIFIVTLCARVPFAAIALASSRWIGLIAYGAACMLYMAWQRVSARTLGAIGLAAMMCFAVHFTRWSMFAPASVTVLDVGQGDAILVRDGGRIVLVDAGVNAATREALARNNVFGLDAVVITHWDRDHWGGLPELASSIPVSRILVAEGAGEWAPHDVTELGIPIDEMGDGDEVRIGGFSCRAVWPDSRVTGEENADSLVLRVSYGEEGGSLTMLLTGDSERDELARYANEVGDIDVLKVGHHGSRIAVDEESLEVLEPEFALASAGEGNRYGHPDPACVKMLTDSGARFACTMDVGDIVVRPGKSGAVVRVERPGAEPRVPIARRERR